LLREKFPHLIAKYEARYGRNEGPGKDYERALERRIIALQEAFGLPGRNY
jgi:hypothetical protein